MHKTYILALTAGGAISEVEYVIRNHPQVLSYWNYIPFVFCLKSNATARELATIFEKHASHFFIAEIEASNVNGRLPKPAWEWFNAPVEPDVLRGVRNRLSG
jgi:hypothetical protein